MVSKLDRTPNPYLVTIRLGHDYRESKRMVFAWTAEDVVTQFEIEQKATSLHSNDRIVEIQAWTPDLGCYCVYPEGEKTCERCGASRKRVE